MLKKHSFYQKAHAELSRRFGENFTITHCDEDNRYTLSARFVANDSLSGSIQHGRERVRAENKQGFEMKTGWWLHVGNLSFFGRDLSKLFEQWATQKVADLEHQLAVLQKSLQK